MKALSIITLTMLITVNAYALHKPAPVDEYPIHKDGGLIYNPLSREADLAGQSTKYVNAPTVKNELKLGQYNLQFEMPQNATAYDVIPIRYRLSWTDDKASFPVAVEATAFEDEKRRKGRDLFDLALPGKLDLKVEYQGSITAHMKPNARHIMKPDMSDTPGEYPPFTRKPMTRSGVVEAGDLVWFKFKFTNTGNTILDAEGMGGFLFYPELYRKNAEGKYDFAGSNYNLYIRDLKYLYPGESHETWVHFRIEGAEQTPQNYGLVPGQYMIRMRAVYRWYKYHDTWINMWDGAPMYTFEQPFTVEAKPRKAPVEEGKVILTDANEPDKITRWIHTFEEFMTAFDCHIEKPEGRKSVEGTLNLQVAPWTKHVVIKLIGTNPVSITSVAVPVNIESKSLKIRFNPNHPVCVIKDGVKEPAIYSQAMADMRTNVQFSPFPEKHIKDRLKEMMDCGINTVCTTSMPWMYDNIKMPFIYSQGNELSNHNADAWKYFLDIARQEGMNIEGWGSYPFNRSTAEEIANWITGGSIKLERASHMEASYGDPNLPYANSVMWLHHFYRWGDTFFQDAQGFVPFSVEDTRGWMRQDVNVRHPAGPQSIIAFQEWTKDKYKTIDAVNAAWESNFKSFDEINPEANQVRNQFGHLWEYTDLKNPFHDWSPAIEDFDIFRTEQRVKNYKDTLTLMRKEIPGTIVAMRTEGANVMVSGVNPESRNPHMRHIYYSQRRCGAIADILQKSKTVRYHSDYTTIPYTPSELRVLTRTGVTQGIIPVYLAQFDNMRDIAINAKYGTDYQINYNISEPKKGMMMHVLTAVYPWQKAIYEEGGTPGILWEDYQCDGFVTETQIREMRFFKEKLEKALNSDEAKKLRKAEVPSQEWRKKSKAKKSFNLDSSKMKP